MKCRCGESNNDPLPDTAADVQPSSKQITRLLAQTQALSPVFTEAHGVEILAEQACFLPIADRGRPLVGKVKGVESVYVASGHSCWGITQGPGTGKVMSELILEGSVSSADISKLAP
jgi:glycine/D-amino acid oxidase-like deaminating enzyme